MSSWLSVNASLPSSDPSADACLSESVAVLMLTENGNILKGTCFLGMADGQHCPLWCDDKAMPPMNFNGDLDAVTHWMSLPEPPKSGS